MSKIVLVNPPYAAWDTSVPLPKTLENTMPSFGLCCLASVLREKGYEPKILEAGALQLTLKQTIAYIIKERPKVVGFRASTISFLNAAFLAKEIKEYDKNIITLIGGPHVTALPIETIQDFPQFDAGIIGEGEETIIEFLEAVNPHTKDFGGVKGLVYRHDGAARLAPKRPYIENLDTLPIPAWDLLEGFPERYQPPLMSYKELPVASMVTSRGCPFQCIFCDRSVFGNRYRCYSADYVIKMIGHLVERYGIRHIIFYDDLFAASGSRIKTICESIMAKKLNISWTCDARVNTVTPETLALMKKAECWEIAYGIESGSQKILDLVAKGITLEEIEKAVRWTHEAGIKVKGLFMMGHPLETRETIKETIDLAKRLPFDIINISKFTPFPGTEIYKDAHKYGQFSPDWKKMNAMNFVFIPHGWTEKELDWEYKKAIAKYYWRPQKTLSLFIAMLKDPAGIKRLLIAGWDVMIFFILKKAGRVKAA
ncbi:MAG: radical SAM protein [Deltaproteobacteria bacterium]|nr:radical SAM protein [Deltaproteobacteria bacterium]